MTRRRIPPAFPRQWAAAFAWVVVASMLAVTAYLSLRGTPQVSEVSWVPGSIGGWADRHGNLRHLVAGLVLAASAHLACALSRRGNPAVPLVASSVGCGAFVLILELLQAWQPGRSSDWRDVAWGLGGVLAGGILWGAGARLFHGASRMPVGAW